MQSGQDCTLYESKRWSAILPPAHWSWPKEIERLHEPKKRDPGSNRALRKPTIVTYRKLPVVTLTSFPIDSPDTTSSTRRFSYRPAELSFEATGRVLSNPVKQMPAHALYPIALAECKQINLRRNRENF